MIRFLVKKGAGVVLEEPHIVATPKWLQLQKEPYKQGLREKKRFGLWSSLSWDMCKQDLSSLAFFT
jgi:hypothetical protein